jgi:hypothetical protein
MEWKISNFVLNSEQGFRKAAFFENTIIGRAFLILPGTEKPTDRIRALDVER